MLRILLRQIFLGLTSIKRFFATQRLTGLTFAALTSTAQRWIARILCDAIFKQLRFVERAWVRKRDSANVTSTILDSTKARLRRHHGFTTVLRGTSISTGLCYLKPDLQTWMLLAEHLGMQIFPTVTFTDRFWTISILVGPRPTS